MPVLALLQGLEHQHAGGEIDPVRGERECFGQPAAGIDQGHAEGANLTVGALGFPQERLALTGGDVFPGAVGGVEPQAGGGRGGMPFGCRVQGRRGPGGSARAAPSLLWSDMPSFRGGTVTRADPGSRGGAWRGQAGRVH